ncbi:hypothetical protein OG21DRAFT_1138308 [Imleria badia]|nr:hypothetical protein OG21DRAFT_1138308 [Imleria badia]
MLFTHPEHRFSVPANSTALTVGLSAFLQAFYTIYTAVLVLMTQQLALSATMSKKQTLTAVHDIVGAWNGIGAAISALWQQTKVVSSPLAILLVLGYLSCISGLHIISSSVIQFEAFNNTITSAVPSMVAWPSPSVNLSNLDWRSISALMVLWPLLTTAKGLTGSTLYDVPSPDYTYTGAVVNATTISAECGLLSNHSVGTWDPVSGFYDVNISGLGEVALPVSGLRNTISFINMNGTGSNISSLCSTCNNYIGYQVSTEVELNDLTGRVLQVDFEGQPQATFNDNAFEANVSSTTYFVACVLNATLTTLYLPMQNGKVTDTQFLSNNSEIESWTIWSPGPTTELTQMVTHAHATALVSAYFCQVYGCGYMSHADLYTNALLNISWITNVDMAGVLSLPTTTSSMPTHLYCNEMQNAIAQTAAGLLWLACGIGVDGGFQQAQGDSFITNHILEHRLNVNGAAVIFGLIASNMLLAIILCMFYNSYSTHSARSVTNPGILGLAWISARSKTLQDLMKKTSHSIPDHLRLKGMKDKVCLAELASEPTRCHADNSQLNLHAPQWQKFVAEGLFL